MSSYETIEYQPDAGRLWIRINRPDKRNALSPSLIRDLGAALDAAQADAAIRTIIITGNGKAFSSGLDLEILREISDRSHDENLADSKTLAALFLRIHRFPKPVIAAVNGPAIAGGCGLATVCDFTIASTEAKFGYTEVRIGFVAAIVAVFLMRIVGEKITRDLLLTARIFDAEEALKLGLVSEVVSPDQLDARAAEIADALAANSPSSLLATKQLLSRIPTTDIESDLNAACELNAQVRATPDCKEGVTSFLEKRKPTWNT
jgi:methylglutaconyl-CoA hydratase